LENQHGSLADELQEMAEYIMHISDRFRYEQMSHAATRRNLKRVRTKLVNTHNRMNSYLAGDSE
jgi:hypothetical protein